MTTDFDVCIVGGGLIGSAAACCLGDAGLKVALVEAILPANKLGPQDDYRLRVSAINAASTRLFKNLGVWPAIKNLRVSPYSHMQIWDGNLHDDTHSDEAKSQENSNQIEFHAHDLALPQLGHIIENDVITQALSEKLAYLQNVTQFHSQLNGYQTHSAKPFDGKNKGSAYVDIQLDQQDITAKLLIGADGQNSKVRELAHIPCEYGLFDQLAIVARIKTERPHQQTAYQQFHSTGPIAYLPLADGSCSIVWSCDQTHAKKIMALDEADFAEAVAEAMSFRLGSVELLSPRGGFELKQIHAQRYISERIALIGDAAHRTHPLAGLGANIGFIDAAALAQTVATAQQAGRDIGLNHTLRKYERWRRGQNAVILGAMQGFKSLFGSETPALVSARRMALSLANRTQPIKSVLTSHAMGLGGDLPLACQTRQ